MAAAASTAKVASTSKWAVTIGLEIHAQVLSNAKMFSRASASFALDSAPNRHVELFDAAIPGTLPRVNKGAVLQAVRTGLAIGGNVQRVSKFERKHYMYADLPAGYQITQLDYPIVLGGKLSVDVPKVGKDGRPSRDTTRHEISINRIQLEVDSGKSVHTLHPSYTLVDLNRTGVALMEIVTEPCMTDAAQAGAVLRKLQALLRHVGTCDGNMEEGSMRCDVNVSLAPVGSSQLGPRVEMKNVNSVRSVIRAIEYEVARQTELLAAGRTIERETRTFDAATGTTTRLRSKEDAMDYRFMPEPNLPPLLVDDRMLADAQQSMPELLDAIQARFMAAPEAGGYGLSKYDAAVLVGEPAAPAYFEAVARAHDPKAAANWIINELFGYLRDNKLSLDASPVTADRLSALLQLLDDGIISGRVAKDCLKLMFVGDARTPREIVDAHSWAQISDAPAITSWCQTVLDDPANAAAVANVKGGNQRVFGHLVGSVMKLSDGKANPKMVNDIMLTLLGK